MDPKIPPRAIKNSISSKVISSTLVRTNYECFSDSQPPEISQIAPVEEWINFYLADSDRGYASENLFSISIRKIVLFFSKICEELIGRTLYAKIEDDDLLYIEPRFQKIAHELQKVGIVSSIERYTFRPDWPQIPYYSFSLNPIPKPNGGYTSLVGSLSGSGLNSNEAFIKALTETLERHALCSWDHQRMIYGSFIELKNTGAVDSLSFKSFSEKQLRIPDMRRKHSFDYNTRLNWLEAHSLLTGKTVLVPAQLVYIGYRDETEEPVIRETNTNGAAAGETWERATYAAICEAVERDALMIFWLNKIAPPRIDATTLQNNHVKKILREHQCRNIEVHILDVTTDVGLPIFLVVSVDRTGVGPAISVGSAADIDPEAAILKALLELMKVGPAFMPYLTAENFKRVDALYPNFSSIMDRGLWWAQSKAIGEIEWLWSGKTNPLPSKNSFPMHGYAEKLEYVRSLFVKLNQDVFLVDATSPVARKYHLWVVTSLIPGFYPLYLSEKHKYLGISRLYELPVKLGFLKEHKDEEDMNLVPHPIM